MPRDLLAAVGRPGGGMVRLVSYVGREAFVDASVDPAGGAPTSVVRLGRLLWSQLGVRPGDDLTIERAEDESARRVVLTPAFHLSHHLEDRVVDAMRADGTVVWRGALVSVPVFAGGGGVVVRADLDSAGATRVGPDTEVAFADPDADVGRRKATLSDVGGIAQAIGRLRALVELPLLRPGLFRALGVRAPRGMLLHGPPGTGKTLLARAIAADLAANATTMSATELVGSYSGETEAKLRALFNEASHHAPTLIVIDEIDVLTTARGQLASQADVRATTQLLALLDGLDEVDGVVVLATTNRIEVVDDAFRRPGRFDEELYLGPPDGDGRAEILAIHTREMPLTDSAERALSVIAADHTPGFTGADLMGLAREIGLAAARRIAGDAGASGGFELSDALHGADLAVEADDVWAGVSAVSASTLRPLPEPVLEVSWDAIFGLDDVKAQLESAALAALAGAPGAEGVLVTGAPGNGKSALLAALADQVHANLVVIDGSAVFSQWLGESEAAVRALFARGRQAAPAIVVVEHVDAIAPRRGDEGEHAGRRVLAAFLSSIDSALADGGVFIAAITDRPDLVDPAVVRPGRLGRHVEVPYPDDDRRRAIACSVDGFPAEGAALSRFVSETSGLTAAEVVSRAWWAARGAAEHGDDANGAQGVGSTPPVATPETSSS